MINQLPSCFTIQSCYGYYIYPGQNIPFNLDPLPDVNTIERVEYKIAYIRFCAETSSSGRGLIAALKNITAIDPQNVQICSAKWFWEKQVNSYARQVQPEKFKRQDRAVLEYKEALYIEKIRNEFFNELRQMFKSI